MNTTIPLSHAKILLTNNPNVSKEKIVLFIPGISGDAFSERFQPVVDIALNAHLPIARVSAWESHESVQTHSYAYYQEAIKEVIQHLETLGYSEFVVIGKSFGGGLALSLHHPLITRKILWAPAIGFLEAETITSLQDTLLSKIDNLKNLAVSKEYLLQDTAKIFIIHGTADQVMSIDTSRQIVAEVPEITLAEIPNADHSFRTPSSEALLIAQTAEYLSLP